MKRSANTKNSVIPYEVDPSLHSCEPQGESLDDGFSRKAATHPVEPEPPPEQPDAPNPSHLPVEPEFAPPMPPADPGNPQAPSPKI